MEEEYLVDVIDVSFMIGYGHECAVSRVAACQWLWHA
jgi:hypothetical protein